MHFKTLVLYILLLPIPHAFGQVDALPYEGISKWEETKDQRMAWFREARFGLFIHWGLYAGAGGSWDGKVYPEHYSEWIQNWAKIPSNTYSRVLKPKFTASKFNAEEWASLAKEAGVKYVVVTSRHHEGFTLFNSKEPFSLSNPITGGTNISPVGRDLYGEIISAFKAKGLKAGAYYSLLDWQHPDSFEGFQFNENKEGHKPNLAVYKSYIFNQIKELANNYEALDILWPDYSTRQRQSETWGTKKILENLIEWQPNIVINNRFWDKLENKKGDIGTPEKYVPPTGLKGMDWEVSHTMNESYGYSEHDNQWKSVPKIMHLFLETVSKGGNFLLNVGPDANGEFPMQAKYILKEIGKWMDVNGEAIYGTSASPFKSLESGYCTQKSGKLFFHVFDIPKGQKVYIPIKNKINKAYTLDRKHEPVKIEKADDGYYLVLKHRNNSMPVVICTEIEGQPKITESIVTQRSNGELGMTVDNAKSISDTTTRIVGAAQNDPNRPNAITNWKSGKNSIKWGILVNEPGTYEISINYLPSETKSGVLNLLIGKQKFTIELIKGNSNMFERKSVGEISIAKSEIQNGTIPVLLTSKEVLGDMLPQIHGVFLSLLTSEKK